MRELTQSDEPEDHDSTVVDPAVLAERRARRAEMAEESLADRVRAAEELADQLQQRSGELERELADAARERDELLGRLHTRERSLLSLQQQEESERRRRHEVEVEGDADRRAAEQEISDLRVRVGAAETWAAELSAELARTREELEATRRDIDAERLTREELERDAEQRADRRTQELDERRDGLAAEIAELRAQASGLVAGLAHEERQRAQAQAQLEAERERAEAQIVLLEHELDRRSEIHDAVLGQLRALGREVAGVRDGVAQDAQRRAATEETLTEVASTARRLRTDLEALERERDEAAEELQAARTELVRRDGALAQARDEVATVRQQLQAVLAETTNQGAALARAQEALAETRGTLGTTAGALAATEDALATARAAAGALQEQVAAEQQDRARLSQLVADGVAERDAALAQQHEAFQQQLGGVERTVADLRGRLTEAAGDFEQRLAAEQAARQAAEADLVLHREAAHAERVRLETAQSQLVAELAEARAAVQVERERADAGEALAEHVRSDRDRLAAELARREALDEHVRGTLHGLRVELDDLRLQSDAREAREAAVERLVADLVATARELREGFDRELVQVRDQLEHRGRVDLEEADRRLEAMRGHLEVTVEQLRGQLEREQEARRDAEASLGAERHRVEAAGLAAVDAAVARDDLARELQTRQAAEADARDALAAAEEELALLRRGPAPAQADAIAVVESLTRAARRLREESDLPAPDEEQPDPVTPEGAQPAPALEPAPPAASPAASVPALALPAPAPPMEPAPRQDAVPVRPHVVAAEDRPASPWMAHALQRLAEEDPDVALAALVTLLPALGFVATRDQQLDMTVRGNGTWRIALTQGSATVSTLTRGSGDPEATLVGSVLALAPFAAGGLARRPTGIDVIGPRRRLRRLLKARRVPIGLDTVHRAGVVPSTGVLLALLARGVAPEWVAGTDVVDFQVSGEFGGTWRVRTQSGHAVGVCVPDPGSPAPDATLHIADVAVLPLLTALPLPPGERLLIGGDAASAAAVTALFRRAQGFAAGLG